MGGSALVVVNSTARGDAARLGGEVRAHLAAAGWTVATAARLDGLEPGVDLVVAVGGDGTVREMALGLARSAAEGPPLLIVPGGTGNSVYRALWGDRPWPGVLDDALTPGRHRIRRLDLGRWSDDGRAFLLGLSAGFMARVVEVSAGLEGTGGRERYQAAAVAALDDLRPFPGRVTVDGTVVADGPLTMVSVGGARHRAGTFQLLPRSVLDDGLLDVCTIGEVDAAGFAELAGRVVDGTHVGRPGVGYTQGRSIVIERTDGEPLAVETDGDVEAGTGSRIKITVLPGAVPVVAPPKPVAG